MLLSKKGKGGPGRSKENWIKERRKKKERVNEKRVVLREEPIVNMLRGLITEWIFSPPPPPPPPPPTRFRYRWLWLKHQIPMELKALKERESKSHFFFVGATNENGPHLSLDPTVADSLGNWVAIKLIIPWVLSSSCRPRLQVDLLVERCYLRRALYLIWALRKMPHSHSLENNFH